MTHAKNYKAVTKFVKVMRRILWPLFSRTRCICCCSEAQPGTRAKITENDCLVVWNNYEVTYAETILIFYCLFHSSYQNTNVKKSLSVEVIITTKITPFLWLTLYSFSHRTIVICVLFYIRGSVVRS